MSSINWNHDNCSFDPEKYLVGLSPFGFKVMKSIISTWTNNGSSSNFSNPPIDIDNLPVQASRNDNYRRNTMDINPNSSQYQHNLSFTQWEDPNDNEITALSMFCEENYVDQDIEVSSDTGYDRFLSLVASQVSSSPRKESNKSTNNLSVFAIPNLPEQCITSFADNLQENVESHSRIYENSVIEENYNTKILPKKDNISLHVENEEQFINSTKILIEPKITNNINFFEKLSKFAAPLKKSKSEKKNIYNENRSDQSHCSKETIEFPNANFQDSTAENQTIRIPPNHEIVNLYTTNKNAINKEIQCPNDRKYCNIEELLSTQMSTHSQKNWKLSNDITVPSNNVDLPKNWDILNHIPHKKITLHPTKIENGIPNKIKSSLIENKRLLSEITIDETDKAASKKRFNQLKLSNMLPAKKLKNVDCKKSNKPFKPTIEVISDIKTPKLSRKVNENVSMWLSKINEFADTELLDGMDFVVQDSNEMHDNKNNTDLEIGEVSIKKRDNKDQNVKSTETKSFAILNKVQTVITNDDGKMKYKKMNETFEYLPLTQLSCSQSNSKKKSKFVLPTKRDVPKKNVNYLIENLDQESTVSLKNLLSTEAPIEIGITALFREGFCQLDKIAGTVDTACSLKALIFCVSWAESVRYFCMNIRGNSSTEKQLRKSLISDIMKSNTRKVCFEAQDIIMLLIELFDFQRDEVCLKWVIIDPKIGCFLLNPDKPPSTFDDIISDLSIEVSFDLSSSCPKQRSAHYLGILSECCQEMYSKLMENNIWHVFLSLETKIITILSAMELRGICIDTKTINEMACILNERLIQIEREAYAAAGKAFLINSTVQLRTILYDELKLDVKHNISIKETSKLGAKSTSEPVLRKLIPFHPLPALVLNYRHIHKAKSTFVDAILKQSKSGVIRTTWEQTSAATGRIVSCNPNLQAVPRQPLVLELFPDASKVGDPPNIVIRKAFIPRPGHTFVAADFQHIECRVFAHMSNDPVLIESLQYDKDLFSSLTMKWLNKNSIEEVLPDERDKTKHLIYALMYGAGPHKLMEILHLGYNQTTEVISRFLASFPSLRTFGEKIIKQCQSQNGILHSISGRMRKFQNICSSDSTLRSQAERQAINFVIQGSAADLCKTAMVATEHRLANLTITLGHHLLLQIHDELVWEIPDSNVKNFKDLVQEVMQHSGEFCGGVSVYLPVVIKDGKSWGEMK